jgi:hypothetical protein
MAAELSSAPQSGIAAGDPNRTDSHDQQQPAPPRMSACNNDKPGKTQADC